MTGFPHLPEEQYRTPPGFEDRPFIYAYNAGGLTDGATYRELVIPLEPGSDFLLRRITGPASTLPPGGPAGIGYFQFRDNIGQEAFSRPVSPLAADPIAIVPEMFYSAGGSISFDLDNVLRTAYGAVFDGVTNFVWLAYVAFHGVRRFRAGVPPPVRCYEEKEFVYRQPIIIDWPCYTFDVLFAPTGFEPPRKFSFPVSNLDFELYAINWPGALFPPPDAMLYDANGRATSNVPVGMNDLTMFSPPILYPVGSEIVLDVYSRYGIPELPVSIQILFTGVRRIPR